MAKFQMGNDPLFNAEEVAEIKKKTTVKDPTLDQYTRMTFIVRKDLLEKLRDYAYTERIDQKEAINQALESFLKGKKDLLKAPEKPKQTHKRG